MDFYSRPASNLEYMVYTLSATIYLQYHSISCEMRGQSSDDTLSSDSGGSDCDEAFSNESRVVRNLSNRYVCF